MHTILLGISDDFLAFPLQHKNVIENFFISHEIIRGFLFCTQKTLGISFTTHKFIRSSFRIQVVVVARKEGQPVVQAAS